MSNEKYIGLDVHQATISVAVMDSQGKFIMESILETKASTLVESFAGLRGSRCACLVSEPIVVVSTSQNATGDGTRRELRDQNLKTRGWKSRTPPLLPVEGKMFLTSPHIDQDVTTAKVESLIHSSGTPLVKSL
jgi:hypothetical protein